MAKAIMKHYALDYDQTPVSVYADNKVLTTMMAPPSMTITTEFEVIPEDGIMYKIMEEKN